MQGFGGPVMQEQEKGGVHGSGWPSSLQKQSIKEWGSRRKYWSGVAKSREQKAEGKRRDKAKQSEVISQSIACPRVPLKQMTEKVLVKTQDQSHRAR